MTIAQKAAILYGIGYSPKSITEYADNYRITRTEAIERIYKHETRFKAKETDMFASEDLEMKQPERGQGKLFNPVSRALLAKAYIDGRKGKYASFAEWLNSLSKYDYNRIQKHQAHISDMYFRGVADGKHYGNQNPRGSGVAHSPRVTTLRRGAGKISCSICGSPLYQGMQVYKHDPAIVRGKRGGTLKVPDYECADCHRESKGIIASLKSVFTGDDDDEEPIAKGKRFGRFMGHEGPHRWSREYRAMNPHATTYDRDGHRLSVSYNKAEDEWEVYIYGPRVNASKWFYTQQRAHEYAKDWSLQEYLKNEIKPYHQKNAVRITTGRKRKVLKRYVKKHSGKTFRGARRAALEGLIKGMEHDVRKGKRLKNPRYVPIVWAKLEERYGKPGVVFDYAPWGHALGAREGGWVDYQQFKRRFMDDPTYQVRWKGKADYVPGQKGGYKIQNPSQCKTCRRSGEERRTIEAIQSCPECRLLAEKKKMRKGKKRNPSWKQIDDYRLHGYEATSGNRKVEVVRHYEQDWRYYGFIDGKQIQGVGGKSFRTVSEAKKAAIQWLFMKSNPFVTIVPANPRRKKKPKNTFVSQYIKKHSKGRKLTPKQRGKLLAEAMKIVRGKKKNARKRSKALSRSIKETIRQVVGPKISKRERGLLTHHTRRTIKDIRHIRSLKRNPITSRYAKIYGKLLKIYTDKGDLTPRIKTAIYGDRMHRNRVILIGESKLPVQFHGARVKMIDATENQTPGEKLSEKWYHPFTSRPTINQEGKRIVIRGSHALWTPKNAV